MTTNSMCRQQGEAVHQQALMFRVAEESRHGV